MNLLLSGIIRSPSTRASPKFLRFRLPGGAGPHHEATELDALPSGERGAGQHREVAGIFFRSGGSYHEVKGLIERDAIDLYTPRRHDFAPSVLDDYAVNLAT